MWQEDLFFILVSLIVLWFPWTFYKEYSNKTRQIKELQEEVEKLRKED